MDGVNFNMRYLSVPHCLLRPCLWHASHPPEPMRHLQRPRLVSHPPDSKGHLQRTRVTYETQLVTEVTNESTSPRSSKPET